MNSRPLAPLTNDVEDLQTLTPGHFLVGSHLHALPEPPVENERETLVSRYKKLQSLLQIFWTKWSLEYLQNLQKRSKWTFSTVPDQLLGALVLLIEDDIPSHCWKVGRIQQIHPGTDDLVRVVTVKTSNGLLKRSVNKICLLPVAVERQADLSTGAAM